MAKAEAPTKEKAAKAEKKDTAPKAPRQSKFEKLYPEDSKLELLAKENPKKKGSKAAERFEGYTGAKTVGDALAKGVTYADIAYDVGRQFVKVG